jgi:site-specific DNA-methyltransferase (adenine-specific)
VVDVVITDPPYTDHISENQRRGGRDENGEHAVINSDLSFGGLEDLDGLVDAALARARRWCAFWCAIEQIGDYERAASDAYVRALAWVKTNPTPQFTGDRPATWGETCALLHPPGKKEWKGGGSPGIWTGPSCRRDRVHETQKPLWLLMELVRLFTDPGEVVWDPYGGSMTTGVACVMLGRRFIGHEIQSNYIKVGAERLEAAEQGLSLSAYRAGQMPLFNLNSIA